MEEAKPDIAIYAGFRTADGICGRNRMTWEGQPEKVRVL